MGTQPKPALRRHETRPLSVGLLLAQDFTLSAFSLFVDTLRLAADESDYSRPIHCRWTIMAETDAPIRSSCGVEVLPGSGLIDPAQFDYVVVVGGILHNHPRANTALYGYLRRAAALDVKLIGICTGSFILCRAGLMEGRRVCVSWLHYQDFRDEFPDHAVIGDRFFEVDGDRITCAGGAGAADLAAALVERHLGSRLAQKPHQVLLLTPMRGTDGVQPHPPMAHDVSDEQVRRALLMMEQNLGNPLQISMIAQRLELSTRQLERRFDAALGKRPSDLYRELRLRYARWLLETTTRSVTDIALDAGFSDCAHFSRQFKALHGLSPSFARPALRREAAIPAAEPAWADHDRVAVGASECAGQRTF
ncbi:MAG: AraC family transcriptional regulator [Acidiphilium sp. 37-64-53]|uniref:GlxA family transcriptional regulator n=1 Tax=Acidiphilium TaxID=522 RepID=UPI000BD87527|nr:MULTISPECIES: GlxA family transcriptional regulator [Acidiphilium]OYW02303.1 MAG: AraC family transcriptional regulator [Acidiphilium sp. 37-64-53]OZB29239.1 MAG: AraC family transcriptional regulator [Acidiphilium sp. 34-64-41]HQT85457.1 GlxA family transcriptional regulator [Acidiphilium rubrum]